MIEAADHLINRLRMTWDFTGCHSWYRARWQPRYKGHHSAGSCLSGLPQLARRVRADGFRICAAVERSSADLSRQQNFNLPRPRSAPLCPGRPL